MALNHTRDTDDARVPWRGPPAHNCVGVGIILLIVAELPLFALPVLPFAVLPLAILPFDEAFPLVAKTLLAALSSGLSLLPATDPRSTRLAK